ncbi:YiiG family protein [Stenotrophomonas sp.]|uniref:YiiG family protein n=1 Tax=Stenotrophomonas sp. TaxID=69392 RepID=UPI0025DE22B0|nr:YiiG family protein [Stenotrophomonas sp.]MBW8374644.1 YiiG family protein [Stenotrophomonas sp.]
MSFRTRTAPLAAAIALISLLGACSKGPGSAADTQGVEKVNAYIACFNAVEQPIHEGFQQYIGWMQDPEAGPTGNEKQVRGPGTVLSHRVDACNAPMVAALAMTPAEPELDPAASAYQKTFVDLYALIEQADRYYSREDYLRDDHAGMRTQHAPLMKAYMAFFDAGTALDAALEKREDERRAEQLKQIEASEGRSLAYYQIKILGDGKQLTQLLNTETPDLAVARTRLAAFQALLQQAQDDKVGTGDAMWGHVERAADALARDAGRRIERVESGKPYTRSEQMLMESGGRINNPQGSAEALLVSYNDLVDMSNRMARSSGAR